jgi:serine/threonine-protein kinase
VLDLRTGKQKLVVDEVIRAWYLPTGHLFYTRRDGTALAAPFDLDRLELTGPGVQVLDRVQVRGGFAQLAWSRSGSLVFLAGEGAGYDNLAVRVAPDGRVTPIDTSWYGKFASLAIAPDGRRMAIGAGTGVGGLNIWVKQLDRGPFTRLSFGGGDRRPVWSPDGRMVAFVRDTLNTSVVAARFADGSRPDTVLVHLDRQVQEVDWSRDGRWLVVRTDNSVAGAGDIVGIRTGGDTAPVPLLASQFTEKNPAASPDGKWLAYASSESGRDEVYVRPFPNTSDGRWQISTAGGHQPRWSPDGRALYYLNPTSRMIAVGVTTGALFAIGESKPLFDASGFTLDPFHQAYDLTPDGRHFLFLALRRTADASGAPRLVRVDHWFRDIEAKLAE